MRVILLSVALALAGSQASPPVATNSIRGTVTRSDTGAPIAGVQIVMTPLGAIPNAAAELLTTVPPGSQLSPPLLEAVNSIPSNPAVPSALSRCIICAPNAPAPLPVIDAGTQRLNATENAATPVPVPMGAVTDATGNFSIRNVASGQYTISARSEGYVTPSNGNVAGAAVVLTAPIIIADGKLVPDVLLRMTPGGTISGRLRGPNGQALSGMSVAVYQSAYQEGGRAILRAVTSRVTDDLGNFRIFWLAPGEYFVAMIAPPRLPNAAPSVRDTLPRTYFPGITDPTAASRINVKPGQEVSGIDFDVRASGFVKVSGRSIDLAPAPNAGGVYPINLVPHDPRFFVDASAPFFTNISADKSNGQFEIENVPPGSYDLITVSDRRGRTFPGRTTIDVGRSDLQNVTVTIPAGVEVKARLTYAGGPAPANADAVRVQIRAKEIYPFPYDNSVLTGVGIAARTNAPTRDASGTFIFPSVPEARYTFEVTGLALTACITDIRANGVSVFDSGLLIGTSEVPPVEVIVNVAAPNVEGTVINANQKPIANSKVVLVPQQPRRGNPALYRTASTDAAGRFILRSAVPGQYKVFAWETPPPNYAWQNDEFMSKYEQSGQAVTVTPAGASMLQLQAIP